MIFSPISFDGEGDYSWLSDLNYFSNHSSLALDGKKGHVEQEDLKNLAQIVKDCTKLTHITNLKISTQAYPPITYSSFLKKLQKAIPYNNLYHLSLSISHSGNKVS